MKAFGRPPPDSDIFGWLRDNGPQFPDLAILARIVHSVPGVFRKIILKSKIKYRFNFYLLLSPYFFSRSGKMVEKILVIKANMDKIHSHHRRSQILMIMMKMKNFLI